MRTHLPVLLQQADINPPQQVENDKVQQLTNCAGSSWEENPDSLPLGLLCQSTKKSSGQVPFIRLSTSLDTDVMIHMKPALHKDCGQVSKLSQAPWQ